MEKTFSVKQAIGFAWDKFWSRWKFYVAVFVATFVVSAIVSGLASLAEESIVWSALTSILSIIVQMVISIGLITVLVKSARDQSIQWSDMWVNKGLFLKFLGVSILYQLIVLVGLIFLIIPGIYLALRYQYAQYIIVDDKGISIGKAFKRSAEMTKSIKWRILWLGIVTIGVALLGLLALGVGLLVAIPVAALAHLFVYVYVRKTYHGDFLGEESAESSSEENVVATEVESTEAELMNSEEGVE